MSEASLAEHGGVEVDLLPVPESGRIWLDPAGDGDASKILTDVGTFRSHKLLGEGWGIDFHPESGRGLVYRQVPQDDQVEGDEVEETAPLEKFFPAQLYRKSDTQELVTCEKLEDGEEKVEYLGRFLTRHWNGSLHMLVGSMDSSCDIQASLFKKARAGGHRLFISLHDVYSKLQLNQYNGGSQQMGVSHARCPHVAVGGAGQRAHHALQHV